MSGEDWPPNYTITWHNCSSRADCAFPRSFHESVTRLSPATLCRWIPCWTKALTYTRSLVAELSPQILYQFGLAKSLLWLGEQMKQHNLRVSVELGSKPFTLPGRSGRAPLSVRPRIAVQHYQTCQDRSGNVDSQRRYAGGVVDLRRR